MLPKFRSTTMIAVVAVALIALVAFGGWVGISLAQPLSAEVPLQVVQTPDGQVLAFVPVTIQGEGPFSFALDTGASQTLIDRQVVNQLDLPVVGQPQQVIGIAGSTDARTVRVEDWSIGDVPLPPSVLADVNLPGSGRASELQGLLGSDVLSSFGTITIDYESERLILSARRSQVQSLAPQSGLSLPADRPWLRSPFKTPSVSPTQ